MKFVITDISELMDIQRALAKDLQEMVDKGWHHHESGNHYIYKRASLLEWRIHCEMQRALTEDSPSAYQ